MFHVQVTLNANFSGAAPIVTFQEQGPFTDSSPQDKCARILGYSYSAPSSTEHTWRLVLAPEAAAITDAVCIVLEDNALTGEPGTFFTVPCGRDGIIVPRRYGIEAVAQPPPQALAGGGAPYMLFFETSGLDAEGVFHCWYEIGSTQG